MKLDCDVTRIGRHAGWVLAFMLCVAAASPRSARAASEDTASVKAKPVSNPHGSLRAECEACHTSGSWRKLRKPVTFRHETTGFALEGRHKGVACRRCHASLEFQKVGTACADCHRDVHQGRAGTACQDCHTPARWALRSRAVAEHARTAFPLRGAHTMVECARCHAGSAETLAPAVGRDCYACHADAYAATANPSHPAAGFPVTCESCHTTVAWRPAPLQHDALYFRIYTGRHRGMWSDCSTCHFNPASHADFTCFNCHEHEQANTDDRHNEVSGYTYDSDACYSCHRRV